MFCFYTYGVIEIDRAIEKTKLRSRYFLKSMARIIMSVASLFQILTKNSTVEYQKRIAYNLDKSCIIATIFMVLYHFKILLSGLMFSFLKNVF